MITNFSFILPIAQNDLIVVGNVLCAARSTHQVRVLKNRPPLAYCKELWQVTQHCGPTASSSRKSGMAASSMFRALLVANGGEKV